MENNLMVDAAELLNYDKALRYVLQRRELDIFNPNELKFIHHCNEYFLDPREYSTFFQIKEVNKNNDDIHSGLNAIRQILNYFRDGRNSFLFVIRGTKDGVRFNMGLIPAPNNTDKKSIQMQKELFKKALRQTNFGINFDEVEFSNIMADKIVSEGSSFASITGVPGSFSDNPDNLSTRIDDLLNSLEGEDYTIISILEPIPIPVIDELIERCNQIATFSASLAKMNIQTGKQITISKSNFRNYSTATGYNYGTSNSETSGYSVDIGKITGLVGGAVAGCFVGNPIAGAVLGSMVMGGLFVLNKNRTHGSYSGGNTITSEGGQEGIAISDSDIRNITREIQNRSASYTEKIINSTIERFEIGKERGMWNTGIYIFSECGDVLNGVVNSLKTNISGNGSKFEPIRAQIFNRKDNDKDNIDIALNSIKYLRIPMVEHSGHPLGSLYENISTPLTGQEIPLIFNFPRYDVKGIKVISRARFQPDKNYKNTESLVPVGSIMNGAKTYENSKVYFDPQSIKHHVFVCGVTGSGKTNTCLNLLKNIVSYNSKPASDIKFMVIEPAKNHYRDLYSFDSDIRIYTLGNEKPDERILHFRFNPFHPVRLKAGGKWKIFNLQAHIDYVKSAIISSIPMEAAMPSILSEAIQLSYEKLGWQLSDSTNCFFNKVEEMEDITAFIPTFSDIRNNIEVIVNGKGFDNRLRNDYIGSLLARIDGLVLGSKGIMLNTRRHIEISELLSNNAILELDNFSDPDEKSIMMGFIFGAIYEYRKLESIYKQGTQKLKHITLIEEAHHLLVNQKLSENQENISIRSKFVEVFTNMLSEIRAYNEGLIIVEQIPSKITQDVIKNTSTKIIHKTLDGADRKLLSAALVLSEEQEKDIAFLNQGEFIFLDETLHQPQKVKADKFDGKPFNIYDYKEVNKNLNRSTVLNLNQRKIIDDCFTVTEKKDILKVLLEEFDKVDNKILLDDKIVINFLYNVIIHGKSLNYIAKLISVNRDITGFKEDIFSIVEAMAEDEIGKALAWLFSITNSIREYVLNNRSNSIGHTIGTVDLIERYAVLKMLNTTKKFTKDSTTDIYTELKNKSSSLPIKNKYKACNYCKSKCVYGPIIIGIHNKMNLLGIQSNDIDFNAYKDYFEKTLENNIWEIHNDFKKLYYCLISNFLGRNHKYFNLFYEE